MIVSDQDLFNSIKTDNQRALKELMDRYWRSMFLMAASVLKDRSLSEENVKEEFINIWNKRASIEITQSFKIYLFACTRYQIYKQVKQKKLVQIDINQFHELIPDPYTPQHTLEYRDLLDRLEILINKLPPRCREIYQMRRDENLSQNEIAEKLQISRKSVENQMTIALKKLKAGLSRFMFF